LSQLSSPSAFVWAVRSGAAQPPGAPYREEFVPITRPVVEPRTSSAVSRGLALAW